jgi:HSP20 family protein
MAKEHRSFFERLTGGVSISNENDFELENRAPIIKDDEWAETETNDEEGELSVDVYEKPTEIIVQAMIAGVKPEDLTVSVTRDMVTIRGHRENVKEVADDHYFQRELYWGSFARTILLPAEVEPEEAEAVERHGLLSIRIPKINKGKTAKLKIKSA